MLRSVYYVKKAFDSLEQSREEIRKFQQTQLDEIIDICRDLRFYQKKWPSDFKAEGLERIDSLPSIDAYKLRYTGGGIDRIIRGEEYVSFNTSGSTGERSSVAFGKQANDWMSAIYVRTMYVQGYRPLQSISQYGESSQLEKRSWLGRKIIPKDHIYPGNSIEEQLKIIENRRPDVIDYFPQILLAITKFANRKNCVSISPELIFTRGEVMTDSMKDYMEDFFDAPIKDQYGTTEFGIVGWECPEGGYHISEDVVYPEFEETDIANGSKYRKIIFTGLTNPITPLIRYDMGDLVKKTSDKCSCKTDFTKIGSICGRTSDVFRNADSDPVYPDELVEIIASFEDILMYQIVAEDSQYVLKYVPNIDFKKSKLEECAEKLSSELSLKPLETKEVEDIPRTLGGKLEIILNNQTN